MQNQEWHSLRMQLNASDNYYCPSLAAHAFSKRTRLNHCFLKHMFGGVIELLINSIFQYHILLTFMKKTGPGKQVRIIEKSR